MTSVCGYDTASGDHEGRHRRCRSPQTASALISGIVLEALDGERGDHQDAHAGAEEAAIKGNRELET